MATATDVLNEGWRRHQQGELVSAVDCYQQVLQVLPEHPEAWCYMGIAFYDLGRFDESVDAYQRALRAREAFPVAWSNMGNSLSALGRYAEAADACRRAIALKPDYANAYLNLGATLVKSGQLEAAEAALRRSLELAPQNDSAHRNLSAALLRQGAFAQGAAAAQQAVTLNPRSAEAHRNLALIRLLQGDWPAAFDAFEWRWRTADMKLPELAAPFWQGEPLAGKSILLHAEQGLGDTIQFARYATLVQQKGAHVILQCQDALQPLLSTCPGIDQLIGRSQPAPPTDFHCPLMSLPRLFSHTVDTCPRETPYLSAEPQRQARWSQRLAGPEFNVGIVWQGSPSHLADRQRSAPLSAWGPLAKLPGARLISLQKGVGADQVQRVDFPVLELGDELDADAAFVDTAAIIACLDLVVTIDTSVAHLAGALAAPTWVALALAPDWRWLLHREDSVWYPSMRLFRQTQLDDWDRVFQRMAGVLRDCRWGRLG